MQPEAYDHLKIEPKWQKYWETKKLHNTKEDKRKTKFYALIEFPYPSGDGLHVGHIRSNTAMDIISRKRRREGYNVLYPIGWDAFGLPTENYAIKTGIHPAVVTKKNTDQFRRQLKALGFAFDWSREVNTSDPAYYKWTQWIFLQFFKKGLAYKKKQAVNWCPKDLIVLANEEVIDGCCERCGTPVEKKEKEQWMLAITKYADRLDKDLDEVNYLEKIKTQQRNWIGRSEGAMIKFKIHAGSSPEKEIEVFTTRPDTLFGVTYVVLSPEHKLLKEIWNDVENKDEVEAYAAKAKQKTDIDRTDQGKEKTGVELKGVKAISPTTKGEIPVWISDYVLADYGTGAVMAVPAHDERDFQFAKKYGLKIKHVVIPHIIDKKNPPVEGKPSKDRRTIHAIVRNPANGKYLALKWKEHPWTTFVVGGVDDGEDPIEAAKREVTEETGYSDLKLVKPLGGPVKAEYYAAHKGENRVAYTNGFLFELNSENRLPVSAEEQKKFEVAWIDRSEMTEEAMTCAELPFWLDNLDRNGAFTEFGTLFESAEFSGRKSYDVMREITEFVGGKWVTTYKLRDWVFSRQRYWGEPIPVVHCPQCAIKISIGKEKTDVTIDNSKLWLDILNGKKRLKIASDTAEVGDIVRLDNKRTKKVIYVKLKSKKGASWEAEIITTPIAIPEKMLPVKLPNVKKYKPTETGESPLAAVKSWVETKCPVCKGPAKRETDTMPNWAGSSWYYLRYIDPLNKKTFSDKKKLSYWLPVDWYNGGMEHTTLHLLYSRFWHKFLFDLGQVPTKEPYQKRTSHGLILAGDGEKMSKSRGNVVNPDSVIKTFGADALRLYEMFMGPFDQHINWNTDNIVGTRRFIERVWKLKEKIQPGVVTSKEVDKILHKTIKKVSDDIENMRFNTAVSSMMMAVNELDKVPALGRFHYETILKLLAPFAPHVTEELWSIVGNKQSIHLSEWPIYDSSLVVENQVTVVVQINGKIRASFTAANGTSGEELESKAKSLPDVQKWLENQVIKKVIVVPNKLVNIVV